MPDSKAPAGWYPAPGGGRRYWTGEAWSEHFIAEAQLQAYAMRDPYRTNHVLHLLLTVFTMGLWAPVWLVIGIRNSNARARRDGPILRAQAGLPPLEDTR